MNGFRLMRIALTAAALTIAQTAAATWPQAPLVSVDAYDRTDGTALMVYVKDGRRYIVGAPGHEYAVRIRNCTGERILAVTSVDGVNVVSGETASPEQSGYVIDPYGSVEIVGWRKSLERTASFYFTDLRDSYAARTGRPATYPAETDAIQSDRRENLIAMGILPSPRYAQRTPDPFPGMRFVPDPR